MKNSPSPARIALGSQLISCPDVLTLGVLPNLEDYPAWKLDMILKAGKIYFPTSLYADLFQIMGKKMFPSVNTYRFLGDKIKQTLLFQLQGLPAPRTRFYFGPKQQQNITKDFSFPFIAKKARGSSMGHGVWLIHDQNELDSYLAQHQPAYIQEFLDVDDDYRVVVVGDEVVHAYRRIPARGSFKANISQGGTVCLENIPGDVLELGLRAARACGFDLAGIDICQSNGRLYILEANMKFGTMGFHCAGLSYRAILNKMVAEGRV